MTFEIGQRVRIRTECANGYIQPWRGRIKRGLTGTIVGRNNRDWHVQFDMTARVKYKGDWLWKHVRDNEMELIQPEAPDAGQ